MEVLGNSKASSARLQQQQRKGCSKRKGKGTLQSNFPRNVHKEVRQVPGLGTGVVRGCYGWVCGLDACEKCLGLWANGDLGRREGGRGGSEEKGQRGSRKVGRCKCPSAQECRTRNRGYGCQSVLGGPDGVK